LIFSLSELGTINKWSARLAQQGELLSKEGQGLLPVGLSHDGKVAVTLADGRLQFWDVSQRVFTEIASRRWETDEFKDIRVDPDRYREAISISPDLKWLARVRPNQPTQLWNVREHTLQRLPIVGRLPSFAVFSPDGKYLALPLTPHAVAIWNPETGRRLASIPWPDSYEGGGPIAAVAGPLALTARTNVLLWDLQTQRRVGQFDIQGNRSIALSADARMLATGDGDQKVRLYDCQTGRMLSAPLLGHLSGVERVAFAPDGRTLVSAS